MFFSLFFNVISLLNKIQKLHTRHVYRFHIPLFIINSTIQDQELWNYSFWCGLISSSYRLKSNLSRLFFFLFFLFFDLVAKGLLCSLMTTFNKNLNHHILLLSFS